MVNSIKSLIALQHVKRGDNLDAPETTLIHREVILQKEPLKEIYISWYKNQMGKLKDIAAEKILEIGSGGGFIKELYPQIITSDILPLKNCDLCFSAEIMPFEDNSLDAILMTNVFHHLPDCEKFLKEANRVLKPGGKIVMLEPSNCLWSRFIYKNFLHELFDEYANSWKLNSTGPLSGSNVALPWMVFKRDAEKFKERFPSFKVLSFQYLNPFAYLLTGGVSLKQLLPDIVFKLVFPVEKLMTSKYFNMFWMIELQKKN